MFLWLKTLYRKRAVTWPFIFYTIIWTLSKNIGSISITLLLLAFFQQFVLLLYLEDRSKVYSLILPIFFIFRKNSCQRVLRRKYANNRCQ